MDIYNLLDEKTCKVGINPVDKQDAIRILAELACKSPKLKGFTPRDVANYILERENQGTTGFGKEVALPHARVKGLKEFLVICAVCPKGVDFAAMDKKKVKLFFLILAPAEMVNEHVKILAQISRTLNRPGVKNELIQAATETVLTEAFLRHSRVSLVKKKKQQKVKLMYVILYFEEYLYEILEFFIESGIEGATVIESFGMGEYISNIPIFAEFIGFMRENKNQSKTIMVLVPDEKVADIVQGIEEITGDLTKKQGAMIMTQNIDFYKGTMKMM